MSHLSPRVPINIERSVKVYRVLLLLYPAEHRAEYGPHMVQVFRDCCREGYLDRHAAGLANVWVVTIVDLLTSAFEAHARRGITMNRNTAVQLAGMIGVAAGALLLTTVFAERFHPLWLHSTDPSNYILFVGLLLAQVAILVHAGGRSGGYAAERILAVIAAGLAAVSLVSVIPGFTVMWAFMYLCIYAGLAASAVRAFASWAAQPHTRLPGLLLIVGAILVPFAMQEVMNHHVRFWLTFPYALGWLLFGLTLLVPFGRRRSTSAA